MAYSIQLTQLEEYCRVNFHAMACVCEVLLDTQDPQQALTLGQMARDECQRLEHKLSRYRSDNPVAAINQAAGQTTIVDQEVAHLLDFADELYHLSDGRFDITSGILRRAWTFDGSDHIPEQKTIEALLPYIGWHKVRWRRPALTLPAGMEIDFGGIGKELAVDKVFAMLEQHFDGAMLVNFGGDLRARGPCKNGLSWQVGVEKVSSKQPDLLQLNTGAIATSGDSQRYLLRDGIRYSHILDPRSGWPVANAPHAITVCAKTCVQAGVLSTLAAMMGEQAEEFLQQQDIQFWSMR